MTGSIGENMPWRRAPHLSAAKGVVASYMHNTIAPGLGKIGVIVALESSGNPEALKSFGRQIAMHIAAANPPARGGRQPRQGGDRAGARRAHRAGQRVRQAPPSDREDGRGPFAEVLRRGRAASGSPRA